MFLDLEELTAEDLDQIHMHYLELARRAREDKKWGKLDTDTPELEADS